MTRSELRQKSVKIEVDAFGSLEKIWFSKTENVSFCV